MRRILRVLVLAFGLGAIGGVPVFAQGTPAPAKPPTIVKTAKPPAKVKPPVIDVGGMQLVGKNRTAMLMQFLERASEELERSSLETKSFVPRLVTSIDDEAL